MMIKYDNFNKRIEELNKYLSKSKSQLLIYLIKDCIEKSNKSLIVYKLFIDSLNDIVKEHVKTEKNIFFEYLNKIKKIEKLNEIRRELVELNNSFLKLEDDVDKTKVLFARISLLSVEIIEKLMRDTIQAKGEQLFNELFEVDLTNFRKINIEKRNNQINDKIVEFIPVLGKVVSEIKFMKAFFKTYKVESTINESIIQSEPILKYLEEYNINLTKWLNHTFGLGALLKKNQLLFSEHMKNSR